MKLVGPLRVPSFEVLVEDLNLRIRDRCPGIASPEWPRTIRIFEMPVPSGTRKPIQLPTASPAAELQ